MEFDRYYCINNGSIKLGNKYGNMALRPRWCNHWPCRALHHICQKGSPLEQANYINPGAAAPGIILFRRKKCQ